MAHKFENKNLRLYIAALTIEDMLLVREYTKEDNIRDEFIKIKSQVPDLRDFDPHYWHHRYCEAISWDRFAYGCEKFAAVSKYKKAEVKHIIGDDLATIVVNYAGGSDDGDEEEAI